MTFTTRALELIAHSLDEQVRGLADYKDWLRDMPTPPPALSSALAHLDAEMAELRLLHTDVKFALMPEPSP